MASVMKSESIFTSALGDVAEINPRFDRSQVVDENELVSFLPMANVSQQLGTITEEIYCPVNTVLKGFTSFKDRDVLIAKITPCFENGKIAHARITQRFGFGSTEFHVVRPQPDVLDDRYLFHFLRRDRVRLDGERNMTGSAGQRRVPKRFLEDLSIPLPPLPEQRRIAAILDKADALRQKRREAIAKLDQLLQSVFLDMFGDPVTNPKGWSCIPLTAVGKFKSGSTPSKSNPTFWGASFPWVSPKDMKTDYITKSIDHVTQAAFEQTALKKIAPGHLLIVIRGMILARDFPTAINEVDVAINQDMKAIETDDRFNVLFLKAALDAARRQLLSVVSSAGHGTKRFDRKDLEGILVPCPPIDGQERFARVVQTIRATLERNANSEHRANLLFSAVQQRAFTGQL